MNQLNSEPVIDDREADNEIEDEEIDDDNDDDGDNDDMENEDEEEGEYNDTIRIEGILTGEEWLASQFHLNQE